MNKQYNLSGANGYYLTYIPSGTVDSTNYLTQLIQDNDFFPKTSLESTNLLFKNSQYSDPGVIMGSNKASGNSSLLYTQITKPNSLILNKVYYSTFVLYFNFIGSSLYGYTPNSSIISGSDYGKVLNRLRIKLYAQLGANVVPLSLSNLEFYHPITGVYQPNLVGPPFSIISDTYNATYSEGFRLTTGLNSEPCVELGYGSGATISDPHYRYSNFAQIFDDSSNAPNGYNFRVTVSMPNFTTTSTNNKDFNLLVKYYNIAVTGTTYPYNTSETIQLMSSSYVWYNNITTEAPASSHDVTPPSYSGTGTGSGSGGSTLTYTYTSGPPVVESPPVGHIF